MQPISPLPVFPAPVAAATIPNDSSASGAVQSVDFDALLAGSDPQGQIAPADGGIATAASPEPPIADGSPATTATNRAVPLADPVRELASDEIEANLLPDQPPDSEPDGASDAERINPGKEPPRKSMGPADAGTPGSLFAQNALAPPSPAEIRPIIASVTDTAPTTADPPSAQPGPPAASPVPARAMPAAPIALAAMQAPTPPSISTSIPVPEHRDQSVQEVAADATSPPGFWHVRTAAPDTDAPDMPTAAVPVETDIPAPPIQLPADPLPTPARVLVPIGTASHHVPAPPQQHAVPINDLVPSIAQVARKDPGQPVDIHLSPEELGRLRIRVWTETDTVRVSVHAERPETLDLLRRNGEALMREFRAAGFEGGSLDFSGWSGGDTPPAPNPPQGTDRGSEPTFDAPLATASPGRTDANSGLNLRL